jgi:hypothetical protein
MNRKAARDLSGWTVADREPEGRTPPDTVNRVQVSSEINEWELYSVPRVRISYPIRKSAKKLDGLRPQNTARVLCGVMISAAVRTGYGPMRVVVLGGYCQATRGCRLLS